MPNEPPGRRLLVTRPARQAAPLAERLRRAGHHPVLLPLLEIVPLETPPPPLQSGDLLIFISPNAVHHGLPRLQPLPDDVTIATVGQGTARALEAALGRPPDICPARHFDSEGLLAEPALAQVAGRRVFIVRGRGGRETLAETLRARGADVHYVEVYERRRPAVGATLGKLLQAGALDAILITSGEALEHLLAETPPALHARLLALPLLVIHPRQARLAQERGFRRIISATNGDDGAIIEALQRLDDPA